MIYNNIINHLKLWCENKAKAYETVSENHHGPAFVGALLAYELEFKLAAFMDKSFETMDDLAKEIRCCIDVHYEPSIKKPSNHVTEHIIGKMNREFCEYMEELLLKGDVLEPADIPYERIIVGDEAEELKNRFRSVWGYVNTSYWFPLTGDEPKEISDKFYIMLNYLEPYMKQLEELIGLPKTHMVSYGETDFRPEHCIETVEFTEYGGCEIIYSDKDFSWAIYFSHENTVAFAGAIVPKVKILLEKEKEHWDKFEWDFD